MRGSEGWVVQTPNANLVSADELSGTFPPDESHHATKQLTEDHMPFTKETVKKLHAQVIEDLVELAKERGLEIQQAGGTFDGGKCTLKIEFTDIAESEKIDEADFKKWATYINMQPTDYGRTFTHQGRKYKICAVKVGRKFDVGARPTGAAVGTPRTFFPSSYVRTALSAQ